MIANDAAVSHVGLYHLLFIYDNSILYHCYIILKYTVFVHESDVCDIVIKVNLYFALTTGIKEGSILHVYDPNLAFFNISQIKF